MNRRAFVLARAAWWAVVVACLLGSRLLAHPVAQGRIEVSARPGEVVLAVHVSEEELLVSFAQAPATETDALAHHGRYLLQHLQVLEGDEVRLGRLLSAERVAGTPLPAVFRIGFPRMGDGPLRLRQDVLREFDFAPGNPWEASYLVQLIPNPGEGPTSSGRLLTAREPLILGERGAGGPSPASGPTWMTFLGHGWHHILGGYDHLLFLCALVLGARSAWGLVQVVTAFTVAHTLTLVLAFEGWVRIPSSVVEPMIAGSIVVAALFSAIRGPSGGRRGAWIAFGFGLFHGLGFAGGLLDAWPDRASGSAVPALAGFALGVEAGHQAVALPLFGLLRLADRWCNRSPGRGWIYLPLTRGSSALVAVAGMAYLMAAMQAPRP